MKTFRASVAGEGTTDLTPRFNVAPTQPVLVARNNDAIRELSAMRWGLIPSWAKDKSIGNRMINARSETIAEKPAFRAAFKKRRCLVIADGYFEWKKIGKTKQPYWIRMEDDRPFAMAGLWEQWPGENRGNRDDAKPAGAQAAPLLSCTIITTDSNEFSSELHDRMPVILDSDDWDLWLDVSVEDKTAISALLRPYESDAMRMDAVSTHVNNARNEGPECVVIQRELF